MRALIVFESMYGNTCDVAWAIAEGIKRCAETDVVEVGEAPSEPDDDVDLLIVGGPTHAFGMSRPKTRVDAAHRVTTPVVSRDIGIREWLGRLQKTPGRRYAAAFDTRAELKLQPLTGSAARGAAKQLRQCGYEMIRQAESFFVSDVTGPLLDGEIERARYWGRQLGFSLEQQVGSR